MRSSKDLDEFINKRVKVGGLITNVRQFTTKCGDAMANLKLEDFDGVIDVTIFPNVFYQTKDVAALGEIVVVEGRVDNSNDTIQILADAIFSIENYAPDFWLTIPAQFENQTTLDILRKIFAEHTGDSKIFLNRSGVWKKITPRISCDPALCKELKIFLGAENVRLY